MQYEGLVNQTVVDLMNGKIKCGNKDKNIYFLPKIIMDADFGPEDLNIYKKTILLNVVLAEPFEEFKRI